MKGLSRWLSGLAALLFLALPVSAYSVALKDGKVIEFEKYRIDEGKLYYLTEKGNEIAISLETIDLDRTRELNASESPPLQLPGLVSTSDSSPSESLSLGELARKIKKEKPSKTAQKLYTTDDFGAAAPATTRASSTRASEPEDRAQVLKSYRTTLSYLENATRSELAHVVLGDMDEPFRLRADWEYRLFEQKKVYVRAIQEYLLAWEGCEYLLQIQGLSYTELQRDEARTRGCNEKINRADGSANQQRAKFNELISEGKRRAAEYKGR